MQPANGTDGAAGAAQRGMSGDDLAKLCKKEQAAATGSIGTLRKEQERLLSDYLAKADEKVPVGRSNVVSKDVYEVVEWTTPDLMEVLQGGGTCVFVPTGPEDEAIVDEVHAACSQVIWSENRGYEIVHSFVKDGLMLRVGVVMIDWIDSRPGPIERYENLTADQVMQLIEREGKGEIEIKEFSERQAEVPEQYAGGMVYDIGYRTVTAGKIALQSVRPGNFFFSNRAEHIDQTAFDGPTYVGCVIPGVTGSELRKMFNGVDLEDLKSTDARTNLLDSLVHDDASRAEERETKAHDLWIEFIRADVDGDGIDELRRVYRVGDKVLRHFEVVDNNFAIWTPVHVPGRVIGLSPGDSASDIQVIQTALLRNAIDNTRDSSSPIVAAKEKKVNLNDLINIQEGRTRVVRVAEDVDPSTAISFAEQPDRSGSQMAMFDMVARIRERRTGVSSQNQGLDPKMLDGTATGAQLLDRRGMQLRAMTLRQAAHGVRDIYRKVFRMLVQHQDSPKLVKLGSGKWKPLEPSLWNASMDVQVHMGISAAQQPERMALLSNVMGVQEKVFAALGPANPIVTPKHLIHSAHELVKTAGYRLPEQFFGEVPEGWTPPPPPDPNAAKAAADEAKASQEAELERRRIDSKAANERYQIEESMKLKRYQIDQELQLKATATMADAMTGANASDDIHIGGDAG